MKFTEKGEIKVKLFPYFCYDVNKWRLGVYVRDTGVGSKLSDLAKQYNQFNNFMNQKQNTGFGIFISK